LVIVFAMFDLPDFSGSDAIPPGDMIKVSFPRARQQNFAKKSIKLRPSGASE
jgi:hypothetical protein